MEEKEEITLKYAPFCSALDAGFWHTLSKNKLEIYGLDETEKHLWGFYFNGDAAHVPCRLNVDFTAFDTDPKIPVRCQSARGTLINKNTLDSFRDCDKQALMDGHATKIWKAIQSGDALADHSLLSQFILLTFADLKKYVFYYWFAFPCLSPHASLLLTKPVSRIADTFTKTQLECLTRGYDQLDSPAYFIIKQETADSDLCIEPLTNATDVSRPRHKFLFAFCDPCTLETHPGWPLRNYLALIAYHFVRGTQTVEILCYRDRTKDCQRSIDHSIILSLQLTQITQQSDYPKIIGWERNERGKLGPRIVDLSSSMDPVRLSESAVDLNLKLMRWRLLPDLDLDLVSSQKCLLLGSGTLGCNIARCLLGWGVRHITFVDNGKVSFSNPVRQSLFTFDDCLDGGRPKAQAAADSLARIFPGISSYGVELSIPMPGHPVSDHMIERTKKDVERLEKLIEQHDAVFLLLDTRESRWLPTLIGAAKRKIVMNAALGFDTFLVQRHGVKSDDVIPPGGVHSLADAVPGSQLGCYFCNDVVGPGDSTRDRTLDQQCTVSRPGMSMMVAALAVELYVSMLQHPHRGGAPADSSAQNEDYTNEYFSCLGLVPHQIRGFLSRYYHILAVSRAFKHCTACSPTVLREYESLGFNFLLRAFNEPTYLEDLSGLTTLHADTHDDQVWCLSEDESIGEMDDS